MRTEGIRAKKKRRFRVTTDSRHGEPIAPNVLQREFSVEQVAGSDRVWAGDITYISTLEGWLYLAVVLDLGTRSVVGWAIRYTLKRLGWRCSSGSRCGTIGSGVTRRWVT